MLAIKQSFWHGQLTHIPIAILDATFYASSSEHPPASKADIIIPITTMANDTGDDASVPPTFSVGHL